MFNSTSYWPRVYFLELFDIIRFKICETFKTTSKTGVTFEHIFLPHFFSFLQCMLQVAKNLFTHLGKFKDDAVLWSQMPLALANLHAKINLLAPHSLDMTPKAGPGPKTPHFTVQESVDGTELDVGIESLESCDSFGRVRGWRDMSEKEVESVDAFLHRERSMATSEGIVEEGLSESSESSSCSRTCSRGSEVGSCSSSSAGSRQVLLDRMEKETLQALTELGLGSSMSLHANRYPLFKVTNSSGSSSSSIICAKSICSSGSCPHSSTATLGVPSESLEVMTSKPAVSRVEDESRSKGILCECCHRKDSEDLESTDPHHHHHYSACPPGTKRPFPKAILTTPSLSQCLLLDNCSDVIPCECHLSPSGHLLHTTFRAGIRSLPRDTPLSLSYPSIHDASSSQHSFASTPAIKVKSSNPQRSGSHLGPAVLDPHNSNSSSKVPQGPKALLGTDDADRLLSTKGSNFQLDWNASNVEIQQVPLPPPVPKGPSLLETCRWIVLGSVTDVDSVFLFT